ncbi:hypothetical protein [Caproiciproducens sp.]
MKIYTLQDADKQYIIKSNHMYVGYLSEVSIFHLTKNIDDAHIFTFRGAVNAIQYKLNQFFPNCEFSIINVRDEITLSNKMAMSEEQKQTFNNLLDDIIRHTKAMVLSDIASKNNANAIFEAKEQLNNMINVVDRKEDVAV